MTSSTPLQQAFEHHPRQWQDFKYVYPVISRRAGGLSIGINLSTNKFCNLNCIYCCVQRNQHQPPYPIDLHILKQELDQILDAVKSQTIWQYEQFKEIPQKYKRLNDVAFSGDGEPTLSPSFEDALKLVSQTLGQKGLSGSCKTIVITNASTLHLPQVKRALATLKGKNASVWAKLDAGSPYYFQMINQSHVPYEHIIENIQSHAQKYPTTIQTLLVSFNSQPMPAQEFENYVNQLRTLLLNGAKLEMVQLYTVARDVHLPGVKPITQAQLSNFQAILKRELPQLKVMIYPLKITTNH